MFCAPLQARPERRSRVGAFPLLLAVILAALQAATPFAHAMLHVAAAEAAQVPHHQSSPAWGSTAPEEKPCALCAADHLPALPETATMATPVVLAEASAAVSPVSRPSSAPLDLFCRPPPSL